MLNGDFNKTFLTFYPIASHGGWSTVKVFITAICPCVFVPSDQFFAARGGRKVGEKLGDKVVQGKVVDMLGRRPRQFECQNDWHA